MTKSRWCLGDFDFFPSALIVPLSWWNFSLRVQQAQGFLTLLGTCTVLVVQLSSCLTLCDPMDTRPPCPSPSPKACSNSCPLSQWCHPTISSSHPLLLLPSIFPSIRVFSDESVLHVRWPKYWSFNFSISPSNEHSGLISFRIDWLDLLAVQGILKSLLQHYSSKAPILWRSAFFMVQLSYPYSTTEKNLSSGCVNCKN